LRSLKALERAMKKAFDSAEGRKSVCRSSSYFFLAAFFFVAFFFIGMLCSSYGTPLNSESHYGAPRIAWPD
jgi:uncharacterized BrkB/YihY/UPF0761 family membrane protein